MVRRVFWLNFFDAFIGGIVTLAVPLAMLEQEIDLALIGLVFAAAPLAALAVRMAASVLADLAGERICYSLSAASNAAQGAAYLFSPTALGFAAGKLFDGARGSLIWAVNRSSIIAAKPHDEHFTLGSMVGGRQVYFALGSLSVALLAPLAGYSMLFLLAIIVALITLYLSFGVKNSPAREKVRWSDLAMLGRSKTFYETSAAMAVGSTFYMVMLYLLAPLFLSMTGFSAFEIGLIYAAYFLIFGFTLQYISHRGWGTQRAATFGAAIFAIAIAGIVAAPNHLVPLFFLIMALGDANLALVWEEMIYLQAKPSKKRATDIALLHAPGTVAVFLASAASGFAVQSLGFAPIFLACALSLILYAAWSMKLIGAQKKTGLQAGDCREA